MIPQYARKFGKRMSNNKKKQLKLRTSLKAVTHGSYYFINQLRLKMF